MVNEVKKMKVENLVREINNIHLKYQSKSCLLRLVFDYDKLNDYGKIIVSDAVFQLPNSSGYKLGYDITTLENKPEALINRKTLVKDWINYCRGQQGIPDHMEEAFYFILFALLVVSVDKTDKEEKLSIICDFARMFLITDDEIKDMVEIIKILLGKNDLDILSQQYKKLPSEFSKEYKEIKKKQYDELNQCIKSSRTLRIFSELLRTYTGIAGNNIVRYREYGEI